MLGAGRKRHYGALLSRVRQFGLTVGSSQLHIQWVMGVKRHGLDADYTPLPSAEIINERKYFFMYC